MTGKSIKICDDHLPSLLPSNMEDSVFLQHQAVVPDLRRHSLSVLTGLVATSAALNIFGSALESASAQDASSPLDAYNVLSLCSAFSDRGCD